LGRIKAQLGGGTRGITMERFRRPVNETRQTHLVRIAHSTQLGRTVYIQRNSTRPPESRSTAALSLSLDSLPPTTIAPPSPAWPPLAGADLTSPHPRHSLDESASPRLHPWKPHLPVCRRGRRDSGPGSILLAGGIKRRPGRPREPGASNPWRASPSSPPRLLLGQSLLLLFVFR
jgi:hypothetical protein